MSGNERITRGKWTFQRLPTGEWDMTSWNQGHWEPQTSADLRDLITAAAAALGEEVVCVSREQLRQFGIDCWRHGDDSIGETNADDDVADALTRLTAAPAGTAREEAR